MNAKEKQLKIIEECIKPPLKKEGYKKIRNCWLKEKDNFYLSINLQNFSWNNKDDVYFCFNLTILKNLL